MVLKELWNEQYTNVIIVLIFYIYRGGVFLRPLVLPLRLGGLGVGIRGIALVYF